MASRNLRVGVPQTEQHSLIVGEVDRVISNVSQDEGNGKKALR